MAQADEPVQPSDDGSGDNQLNLQQLTARVWHLEIELAALKSRLPSGASPAPAIPQATVAAPPPPYNPPPQLNTTPPRETQQATVPKLNAAAPPHSAASLHSFEDRLGSQIFNRIAIVLLLIGTAYGLKLAVDRDLIGPTARILMGLVAGAGLVVWSERFRHKGFAAFSYSLKAVGSGVLYLSLWAAFQIFHLLPAPAALSMMILVTAWNAYMAWAQDSELLAAYALAGGLATPLMVSTGGNHEIFLFTYLLAIDIATIVLLRWKTWPRLLLGVFPATVLFFIGWDSEFFAASDLTITSIFIVLFGAAFASVPIGRDPDHPSSPTPRFVSLAALVSDVLLPLANAAFVALALYSVLQDSGHHALLPWLMIALAAAYLALMQAPQTRTASAIHLSLAVVFLTIAIPLKASGHWITASWLVEGLALLWVATRLDTAHEEESSDNSLAPRTLRWLGLASLLLGFCGVCFHLTELFDAPALSLLNKGTGTAITGIVIFATAAWLALKVHAERRERATIGRTLGWNKIAITTFLLIGITAILLTARELLFSWQAQTLHPAFRTADFLTALLALAVLAALVAMSLRVANVQPGETFWSSCAAYSTIAFNLIAVLTGVREVTAIWNGSSAVWTADAALRQALAISAFLMIYGAALLAIGFRKRSGFLRWQSLLLLMFTILKTFLYDMRSLSQGYRVASVLGLGMLLMAISFAYQKDWLHLRTPQTNDPPAAPADANPADSDSDSDSEVTQ